MAKEVEAARAWQGTAFNQATASENRIHSDEIARQYGFRGGLVPGVTVHAYLCHPAIEAWGRDWLERGSATCLLKRPLYDRSSFRVDLKSAEPLAYRAELIDDEGTLCAEAEVALPQAPRWDAPVRRGDRRAPALDDRPEATRSMLEEMREHGFGALELEWTGSGELDRYLRDPSEMPALLRPEEGGLANPAFSLGLSNWVLAQNVRLGPWIHVQSEVQHHAAIERNTGLVVEARVTDLFERNGHEFVDLEVGVFGDSDRPLLSTRHRAIYRLRPAA